MTSTPVSPEPGPADSLILHTTDNAVLWITLNRPAALNALTWDQRERVITLLSDASADPAVRAVVLTATGKGFCAGADLRGGPGGEGGKPETSGGEAKTQTPERAAGNVPRAAGDEARAAGDEARTAGDEARTAGDVARMIRRGAQRLITAVLDCEKPVLAAVNGTAAGLGAHLALACDLVVAAESATFIEVFVRRGLVPDGGGAYLLPRLVGPQRAKELLFFGDAVTASDAERMGLINRVVPDAGLEKAARDWAERLATGPTRALALTKQLVNASLDSDRGTAFAAEAAAQEINMTTADAREGVASFVERRRPTYRGR
ncbi:enoyl-CoA hydratase [Streptomyces sp. CB02923]|uniref:enoyl-CoA hydratase/isomerase family protein n=1 Tax=Streptomyces sp. CB02923 TaxID=1718985 RepID=UPI0009391E2E|nr:enoyl-CoA hydratase-related protein [Streptomyces sp. CB02923]OKI03459.1 enoyl-CoA hydratase [Streptomyces sp. CB02923]